MWQKNCKSVYQRCGEDINYAMLPDLRVGDGQIQLVIANNDMQKLEHKFKLYQQDCLKQGESVPVMNTIDMETYKKTGNLTPEEYIHTADDEIKKINQKYDREPGAIEQMMFVMDRNFNIISGEKRKYAEELFNSHYNLSGKEQNITQSIRNNLPNRTANKIKAPAVPMKVK